MTERLALGNAPGRGSATVVMGVAGAREGA